MAIVLANNAYSTLSANASSTDTVLYITDTDSFPALGAGEYFYCTLESVTGAFEIVKVTQVNSSTFNVERGQEGTIAIPFNIGTRVELRVTVQSLEDHFEAVVDDVVDAAVAAATPGLISNTPYDATWDGVTDVAPSKNAVYDELAAIETAISALGSVISLRGTWDASAGTFPGGGTAKAGYSYIVSVAGTVDGRAFIAGDRIIAITNNASTTTYASNWFHADYTDAVSSVAGRTGAVTLSATDISDSSSNGRSMLTAADYAAMRTLLGLGTMALETASNYALLSGATFTGNVAVTTTGAFQVGFNKFTGDAAITLMADNNGGDSTTLNWAADGVIQWYARTSTLSGAWFLRNNSLGTSALAFNFGTNNATFTGTVTVPDDAYAAGWDGNLTVPTKNAVYDKIQTITGLSDGDKGDITVSASGATWTIDNNVVTLAKMATMATDSILGRATAATGNVEVLTALPWAFTGDVTSVADSNALTIANSAVTLAKMANMATSSLIYRKTAGTGAPEVNTLATLKTDLGLTGTNSGDQTITLTGDVTGSGTGSFAATIANNAVTLAKMATMATDSILGRATAATGNVEVLTALPFAFTGDVTRAADSNAQTIASGVVTYAKMASAAIATATEMQAGTASKLIDAATVLTTGDVETVSYSATTTFDFTTFVNAKITLTGNVTFANPTTTGMKGRSGWIEVIQDATGSRTATWGANYKFAGGTDIVLSTTANAVDLIFYCILSDGTVYVSAAKDAKN